MHAASGGKLRVKLRLVGTGNRLNFEHRTPNIERPILQCSMFIFLLSR